MTPCVVVLAQFIMMRASSPRESPLRTDPCNKHNAPDWIDQTEIHVKSSTGQEWSPETAAELVTILGQIRAQGATLTHLIIKGHGGPDGIHVGDGPGAAGDGDWMVLDGNRIFIGDSEVTATLNAIHDGNSHIDLRG